VYITLICPHCQKRYQLDPELEGKNIRCPNPACREIIEVQGAIEPEEAQPPAETPDYEATGILPDDMGIVDIPEDQPTIGGRRPPGPRDYSTGKVGDIVPILPSREIPRRPVEPPKKKYQPPPRQEKRSYEEEEVARHEPPARREPPPRREPPARREVARREPPPRREAPPRREVPRRRGSDTEELPPVSSRPEIETAKPFAPPPSLPPEIPEEPEEALNWMDAPPPVRTQDEPIEVAGAEPSPMPVDQHGSATGVEYQAEPTYAQPSKRRRARWMVITLMAMVVVILTGTGVFLFNTMAATENKRLKAAQKDYAEGKYLAASEKFDELRTKYPKSERADSYDFFASLGDVRDQVYRTSADPEEALKALRQFTKGRAGDPLLQIQENSKDIWQTYMRSIEDVSALAQQNLRGEVHFDVARRLLSEAQKALEEAKPFAPKEQSSDETRKLSDHFVQLDKSITKFERRDKALAELKSLHSTPDDILRAEGLGRQHDLQKDPEYTKLLKDLKDGLISQVSYEASPTVPPARKKPEPMESGLLVTARLGGAGSIPDRNGVVLAMVRGILYALAESDGSLLWATRSGVDVTRLPVRLPATETAPEMTLVLSDANEILTARDLHSGRVIWKYDLHAACLGQPMIVGLRAYIPTVDGKVHEIELVSGHLLGWYKLGLPMTHGGAHLPGSNLLYFPADSLNVYVLDVSQQKCVGILQSGHPSGTLRADPILVGSSENSEKNPNASADARFLILSQTDGLSAMKLRAFPLPIEGTAPVSALQPEPRIRGWSWLSPFSNGEKLVLATDAGILGMFGIQQPGNDDKPIFSEAAQEISLGITPGFPVRSQVIQVQDDDMLVLVNGELQRIHFDKYRQKVTPLWNRSLPLGTPLHAAQVDEKTRTAFTVTQSIEGQSCQVTAVGSEDGQIHWQRQLGMICKGDPLVLGSDVLTLDQGGGFFRFDSGRLSQSSPTGWQSGGDILAPSLEHLDGDAYLLPGPDGRSASEVACVKKQVKNGESNFDLLLRHYEPGKDLVEKTFNLGKARLAGTPGIMSGSLLVPLDDGSLLRQPVDGSGGKFGPGWKARHADVGARGHAVVLSPEDFLTTDGSHGLSRWHWPAGDVYKEVRRIDLPQRLVSAPLVISSPNSQEFQIAAADAGGFVRLLKGSNLEEIRHWDLKGKRPGRVTAGPFLGGNQILCVINDNRLVSLDLNQDKPAWEYESQEGAVVGKPELVGDMIVVANVSGQLVGLDSKTGKPHMPQGSHLTANVGPAAAPVPLTSDRAFVPLTDGTIFFLPLSQLRQPQETEKGDKETGRQEH
jgi:outer membrane protein assembly factor BamB